MKAVASTPTVEKMEYRGYLDDEAFASFYARHLFEVKKYDIKRISYELHMKGVSSEIIDNTLKSLDNEPITRIIDIIENKYINKLNDEKERKRLVNRFVRMGYSYHDIMAAFRNFESD